MKLIGIKRKIDNLGRIVIPKEIRRELAMENFSEVEMFVIDKSVVIRMPNSRCTCGEIDDRLLIHKDDIVICKKCLLQLYVDSFPDVMK